MDEDGAPVPRRGVLPSVAVAIVTAVTVTGLTYGLVAGPVYILASIAPDGLDDPGFRNALLIGFFVCSLLGIASGVAVGVWTARGGRLPTDRTPYLDR